MDDLKQTIARNIIDLRKSMQLTQAELAEKLNYSDKAVSKWERAESVPDVAILKQIAELFGVTVDYLLLTEHPGNEKIAISTVLQDRRNKLIISLLAISLVWLIATVIFVGLGIFAKGVTNLWIIYVYAMPVTYVVLLVFNSIWGNRRGNFIIISLLVWSILMTLYLSVYLNNIWLIFIIGIPAQIIIVLWSGIKVKKK